MRLRRRTGVSALALMASLAAASTAWAQTSPTQPDPSPAPTTGSGPVVTVPAIEVTAQQLDRERSEIQPSLGATRYDFGPNAIKNIPLGDNASLNQVLLRAPGVVQDGFGQIHVRGDHGSMQYRLDGVQLPEGLALFSQISRRALPTHSPSSPVPCPRSTACARRASSTST